MYISTMQNPQYVPKEYNLYIKYFLITIKQENEEKELRNYKFKTNYLFFQKTQVKDEIKTKILEYVDKYHN